MSSDTVDTWSDLQKSRATISSNNCCAEVASSSALGSYFTPSLSSWSQESPLKDARYVPCQTPGCIRSAVHHVLSASSRSPRSETLINLHASTPCLATTSSPASCWTTSLIQTHLLQHPVVSFWRTGNQGLRWRFKQRRRRAAEWLRWLHRFPTTFRSSEYAVLSNAQLGCLGSTGPTYRLFGSSTN